MVTRDHLIISVWGERETLSHYSIVSKIGAGGMGEVYLTEDTQLRPNVVGQSLSASIAQDKVRLHRFDLETFECILHPAQFRTFSTFSYSLPNNKR